MRPNKYFLLMIVLVLITQGCAPAFGPNDVATGVAGTLTSIPSTAMPSKKTLAPTLAG